MDISPPSAPDPEDVALVQQIFQAWGSGNQPGAIEMLRPKAEADLPWAAAFMAWLYVQQGVPGFPESIGWAIKSAQLGAPWQAVQTFNNVVANVPANPQLGEYLPELLRWASPWIGGVDIVGQGWNLISQGQPELALRIMMTPAPWPLSDPQAIALWEHAQAQVAEINTLLAAAQERRGAFEQDVTQATETMFKARDDLETSAQQAGLLVSTVISDATNALYKADATRNERDSMGAWISGLVVLALAATVAVTPVVLHYLHIGPTYSSGEVIAVHLTSTAALGTFAGVLLARARSRDRAAQRAHDLSTAMGTMISYSNRISDPTERERFMMTMGQLVMQAHLASNSGTKTPDESLGGALALVNAARSMNLPGPTSTT